MKGLSRNNHYLPQSYLDGFADSSKRLWVFDREDKEYRQQGTRHLGSIKDFYIISMDDGQRAMTWKGRSSSWRDASRRSLVASTVVTINGSGRPITISVVRGSDEDPCSMFDKEHNELSEKDMRWRAKIAFPDIESVRKRLQDSPDELQQSVDDAEAIHRLIHSDLYEIDLPRQNTIKTMLNLAPQFARVLLAKNRIILSAPENTAFLTSDNPFLAIPPMGFDANSPYGFGIMTPGAISMMPLSKQTCICFRDLGTEVTYETAMKAQVGEVNCYVAHNSDRFIGADERTLLEGIVGVTRADQWRHGSRFRIEYPDARPKG